MSLELSGTTGVKGVAGSVSAPSVVGDDTNTGISFPAADTIKFSTNGIERLSITNSGLSGDGSGLTGIGGGITVAQQFRQTTFTATNASETYFTSNWEKVDTNGQGAITSGGTFSDPSSGVFSFPATGYYLVVFQSYFEDSGWNNLATIQIETTIDNASNWDGAASTYFGTNYDVSGNNYASGIVQTIFDVTNLTNDKVRFRAYSNKTVSWDGSSTANRTYATFIRLADT